MKLTDEQLNAIMDKADADLDKLKDRCHELYEENKKLKELCDKYEEEHNTTFQEWQEAVKENERLKKANAILEENWLAFMKINQDAIDILESIYMLDNVTITNNACDKIDEAIKKLQGEGNDTE